MREARFWLLFMAAAVLMLVMLGLHMAMLHLEGILAMLGVQTGQVLEYSSVMSRAGSMLWMVFYIVFLAVALYHGLYGCRSILLEVAGGAGAARAITGLVVIVGLAALVFGGYVLIQSYSMGGI